MAILSNLYVILVLRVLHIGGGIMWVGRGEKHEMEMGSTQSVPNPVQVQGSKRLRSSLMKDYQFDFVLLLVAMLVMAVARYL